MKIKLPGFLIKIAAYYYYFSLDFRDALVIFSCKQPSHVLRKLVLRACGMKIGKNSYIYMGCRIYHPWNISVGENTIINPYCILDGRRGLLIGNNVSISERSIILSLEHDPQSSSFAVRGSTTIIEDFVWLGMNSVVLPGIRINRGAVVASCALVSKDIPEYTIVGGVPAKILNTRNKDLTYSLSYKKFFH